MKIALIGLTGAGKTTIAKRLSGKMGIPYVDLDAEIVQNSHKSVAEIFAQQGETAFRQLERENLLSVLQKDRFILATGGGAILREDNRSDLQSRCVVVFLDRKVESILRTMDASGRPLLKNNPQTLYALQAQRDALYRQCANIVIAVTGDIEETTEAVYKEVSRYAEI